MGKTRRLGDAALLHGGRQAQRTRPRAGTGLLRVELRSLREVHIASFSKDKPLVGQGLHRDVLSRGQGVCHTKGQRVHAKLLVEGHTEAALAIDVAVLLAHEGIELAVDGLQGRTHRHRSAIGVQHLRITRENSHARADSRLGKVDRGNIGGLQGLEGTRQLAAQLVGELAARADRRVIPTLAADEDNGGGKGVGAVADCPSRFFSTHRPCARNGKTRIDYGSEHSLPAR